MPLRQQLSSSPRVHLLGCEFSGSQFPSSALLCCTPSSSLWPQQPPVATMGLLGPAWTRGCPQIEPCESWGSQQLAGGGIQSSTGAVHTHSAQQQQCAPWGFGPNSSGFLTICLHRLGALLQAHQVPEGKLLELCLLRARCPAGWRSCRHQER